MVETKKFGRPVKNTDDEIVDAIRRGVDTVPALMVVLGVTHKTSLLTRLRRLESEGRITIREQRGPHPFELEVRS